MNEVGKRKTFPAAIPGDNYSALIKAKVLPDPYFGDNEKKVQWVKDLDWEFSREFNVPKAFFAQDNICLNIESLDTVAEVRINNKVIGKSKNMFKRFRTEVKSALKPGVNTIKVRINSPQKEALKEAARWPFPVPYSSNSTFKNINALRKVQCHPGWDWGIELAVSGIYGEVSLIGYDNALLEHVYTKQTHRGKVCELKVTTELVAPAKGQQAVTFTFDGEQKVVEAKLKKGLNKVETTFKIKNPKLWWPVGYGEQPLYSLSVSTGSQFLQKSIGLRELEIINEKDDIGKSLIVSINGTHVFCKGANWIPCDALPTRQTPEAIRGLLEDAVEANMNMIRVWGGGQYEADVFYETCDELGLLVWQDLMFACSLYPSTDDFVANCVDEVEYQTKRLRDYTSIALWCGDNEVIGALGWYKESKENRDTYLVNYDRLNRACGDAVNRADDTRVFWPSSPCAGPGDFSNTFHDDSSGDMHYWHVWHLGKPFEAYYDVVPRFCSEFGFQSFSSFETTKTFTEAKDWNATSPVMEVHQKNPAGNEKIVNMFSRYFRMPNGFENFIYLSQVQQAVAIKTGVEFWRHLRPVCMGALYWQLNDNWPVASWSSIEYGGHWRQLHYHAKRFYAPVMGTAFQKDGKVEVWIVNDLLKSTQASATLKVQDFKGKTLKTIKLTASLKAQASKKLKVFKVEELASQPDTCFMTIDIDSKGTLGRQQHSNTHFFTPYKSCELEQAKIITSVKAHKDGAEVTLKTDKPAFFVNLEVSKVPGVFSDNSFTLVPGKAKKVIFRSRKETTLAKIKAGISLKSLRDTY
jgi:beta-mannosidase